MIPPALVELDVDEMREHLLRNALLPVPLWRFSKLRIATIYRVGRAHCNSLLLTRTGRGCRSPPFSHPTYAYIWHTCWNYLSCLAHMKRGF